MASNIESKALKDQFDKLQQQQQEKLLRRKQKKDVKQPATRPESTTSRAFGIDDNLDLKLADPPPNGSMFSEELTEHLQDQIREMKDETGRLYKLLSERDLELRQLRKKREEDKASLVGGVTNDTAALKIVELSKKVRELTAECEKERTKAKQAAKRCLDLETEVQQARIEICRSENSNGKESRVSTGRKTVPPSAKSLRTLSENTELMSDADSKQLQDKLKQAELKVSEYRNQCTTLRKELNMAQKVVEQEVGEGANYQQLLNTNSGWRGRAQQITALQKKVNELKSDTNMTASARPRQRHDDTVDDLEMEFMGGSASVRSHAVNRHKEQLRKIEKEKKEQQERLAQEMKALESDHESIKQKLDAAKARNKVLANENKANKAQMQTLLDKGHHDDELIEALFKQIAQLKNAMQEGEKKQSEMVAQTEQQRRQVVSKTQVDTNLVEQLKVIVADKERKVHELEDEIKNLKLAKAQMNGVNNMFEAAGSRPGTGAGGYCNHQVAVETMVVEDYGTISPPPQGTYRAESGHRSRESTMDVVHSGHSAPVDLNPQLLRQIDDLKIELQENKSLGRAAAVERDKLSQLVQVLQQRNEELVMSATEAQQDVVQVRRKNVELEKRLAKANITHQSASSRRTKSKISLQSINFEEDPFMGGENNMEELRTQLEIQRDENEALKAALQRTLKAKEDDLKLYNNMIDETKTIFLEGIRQHRQSKQ